MNGSHHQADRRRSDARMLDTAEGVLVGLRRCSIDEAFVEIVRAAKRHHVGALTIARALVELAESGDKTIDPDTERDAIDPDGIARLEWGYLLAECASDNAASRAWDAGVADRVDQSIPVAIFDDSDERELGT